METLHTEKPNVKIVRAVSTLLLALVALAGSGQVQAPAKAQTATGASKAAGSRANNSVAIVIGEEADSLEGLARQELSHFLSKLYPSVRFTMASEVPERGHAIAIGTPESFPVSENIAEESRLSEEGSFVVETMRRGEQQLGVIAGADPRATLYGVYALLEELGFGFYLSYTATPTPKSTFSFDGWKLADAPLASPRVVFNWHNFLSGITGWNLEDWKVWIDQSRRMRYSTIMTHAYGNNPMYRFSYNGETKPVGYLATTARGRDWGNEHVNDVRQLPGGAVFDHEVFGAEAAKAPEDQRAETATQLAQKAFAYAEERGMDIAFALDVDTRSANPQNVIRTLPDGARFSSPSGHELVRPDTPAGYQYYRAQIQALLQTYPQIDRLAVWTRDGGTPWRALRKENFPEDWKTKYEQALEEYPNLQGDWRGPSTFALAKIVKAYRKALAELGHEQIELDFGSWGFAFLPSADAFMPSEVTLIPLDWSIVFDTEDARKTLAETGDSHPLLPIVWAHHDDHRYIGRPYRPFDDFSTLLEARNAEGFGIIHWTTRPLDLYFKSLARQVWQRSENEDLKTTVRRWAKRTFGSAQEPLMDYLMAWANDAPMFGRETTDNFMNPTSAAAEFEDPEETLAGVQKRQTMISEIDASLLSASGKRWLDYFEGMEVFFERFFESHQAAARAESFLEKGDTTRARDAMQDANSKAAIKQYAAFSQVQGMTRGEKGVLVALNTTWLPVMLSLRQRLRLEPIRYNFSSTRYEPLAQSSGSYSYYAEGGTLWRCLGEKEVEGATVHERPGAGRSVARSYAAATSDSTLAVHLSPFRADSLTEGTYDVEFIFPIAQGADDKQRVFDLTLNDGRGNTLVDERIDTSEIKGVGSQALRIRRSVTIPEGPLTLSLKAFTDRAQISGIVIHPRHRSEK